MGQRKSPEAIAPAPTTEAVVQVRDGRTMAVEDAQRLADAETGYVSKPCLSGICPNCKSVTAPDVNYCFLCCREFEAEAGSEADIPHFGPDFRPRFLLGRGGMGRLYVVEDQAGRLVVLKTILDERMTDRFLHEAQSIAKLNHPNIVTVHLFRPDPPGPYLVMEFCREGTLRHLLERRRRPCDETWFRQAARALLEGLHHAHSHGLVHRDISPENIFFQDSVPKLGDFGLAHDVAVTQMTVTGMFMGKLHYAAPEQIEDASRVDGRADLFSLGATLYYSMTGRSPYPVLDLASLPRAAAPLIEALTKIHAADRPSSAAEALEILDESRPISTRRVTAQPVSSSTCSGCGYAALEATVEAPYCPMCGRCQFWRCPGCEKMTQIGLPFCKHCGLAVAEFVEMRRALEAGIEAAEDGRVYEGLRALFELRRLLAGASSRETASGRIQVDLLKQVDLWYEFLEVVWRERWDEERLPRLAGEIGKLAPDSRVLAIARAELDARWYAGIHPRIPGYTLLRFEAFGCDNDVEGRRESLMAVYRHDTLAAAVGLNGHSAPDVEFVLLPRLRDRISYRIGSPEDEPERRALQEQQRLVRISHHFLLARTTVSRRVFAAIQGREPGPAPEAMLPATGLSWGEAAEWCRRPGLSLPSETEWEFACRAGTETAYAFGRRITTDLVNFDGRKPLPGDRPGTWRGGLVPVASLPANAYGLHEAHGNVWEWTRNPVERRRGDRPEPFNVLRGGSCESPAAHCRSAQRHWLVEVEGGLKNVGFRPVQLLPDLPCQGSGNGDQA